MKKALAFIMSVVFVFSAYGSLVFAEKSIARADMRLPVRECPRGGFLPSTVFQVAETAEIEPQRGVELFSSATAATDVSFEEYLEAQLRARSPEISVYPDYMIYLTETESGDPDPTNFQRILRKILFNNYDILVLDDVAGNVRCGKFTSGENAGRWFVRTFRPTYLEFEESDAAGAVAMMDAEIDAYVDAVDDIPADDVVGKMLVIHDLFCANNVYAQEELDEEESTNYAVMHNEARTAYYLFKYNRAVCQGNVIALKAIYDRLNERLKQELGVTADVIETSFCSSNDLTHVWNVVKVNGNWYHLDITWDDSSDPNEAFYDCFMRCDDEFINGGYVSPHSTDGVTDWDIYADEEVVCNDSRYSQGHIFNRAYYGLITYSDGLYNIDAYSFGLIFRSNSLISTEIWATDPFYEEDYGGSAIILYAEQPVTFTKRIVSYTDGALTYSSGPTDMTIGVSGYTFDEVPIMNTATGKLLLWKPNTFEPLCRAIDLPVITAGTAE